MASIKTSGRIVLFPSVLRAFYVVAVALCIALLIAFVAVALTSCGNHREQDRLREARREFMEKQASGTTRGIKGMWDAERNAEPLPTAPPPAPRKPLPAPVYALREK